MSSELELIGNEISVVWGVPKTPEMRKLSLGLLASARRGESDAWLRERLSCFQLQQYGRVDEIACGRISQAVLTVIETKN